MKEGWKVKPLGEVCKTAAGGTPLKSVKEYYEGGNIPWLLSGEVSQGEITEAKHFITDKGLANSSARLFPPNTVLVAMYGATAGQVGILRFKASTNQAVCGILPVEHFLPEFLYYYFLHKKDELVAQSAGNAQPNISQTKIKNMGIPVASIPEQHHIVAILDEAFDGITTAKANAEKNLQNARALFESHLQSVFTQRGDGWIEKPLEDIATFSQGIQVGLENQSTEMADGLVRFIRIVDYTQKTKDLRFVKDPGHRYWVKESDIVMVRYGTPGLIGRGITGVIANNLFKISVLDEVILNDYLSFFLRQSEIQNYLASQGSSTMPALTFKQLGKVVINYPSDKNAQENLAEKIQEMSIEVDRLELIYQQKLQYLENLKQSLLHQAFNGEL